MPESDLSPQQLLKQGELAIAQGENVRALGILQRAAAKPDLAKGLSRKLALLQLTALNRLQWVAESGLPVKILESFQKLSRDELLEIALRHVVLGQPELAREYFRRGLRGNTNDTLLISEMALTYEQQGMRSKAEHLFNQLAAHYVQSGSFDDVAMRVFSRLVEIRELAETEKSFLNRLYHKDRIPQLSTKIAFILATAARRQHDTEREIDWLILANKRARREDEQAGLGWSATFLAEQFELLQQLFATPHPNWLACPPCEDHFIFILGMPRSGTTLIEQILGAHSLVGNAGESRALSAALTKGLASLGPLVEAGQHQALKNLKYISPQARHQIALDYGLHQRLLSDKPIVTDKDLSNYPYVGVLANLFPNARFLYVQRNPLDNCVSLMQQPFRNAPYANDPEYCIGEFQAYEKTMNYWTSLYEDRVTRINYESLVESPEEQMRSIIGGAGLSWEVTVQDFHMRKNSVRTPSVGQVRNKISGGQVDKWKKYERLIRPAIGMV